MNRNYEITNNMNKTFIRISANQYKNVEKLIMKHESRLTKKDKND